MASQPPAPERPADVPVDDPIPAPTDPPAPVPSDPVTGVIPLCRYEELALREEGLRALAVPARKKPDEQFTPW